MMGENVEFLVQSASTMAMVLFIFSWMSQLYGSVWDKKRLVLGYVLSTVLLLMVNRLQIPILNFVYSFVQINAIAVFVFGKKLRESFLYNTVYQFLLLFCDILAVVLWTVIKGHSLKVVMGNSGYITISCLFNIFMMYFCYRMFVLTISKNELKKVRISQLLIQFAVNLFAFFVIEAFVIKIDTKKDGIDIFIMMLGFLIMNILLVYMIQRVAEVYQNEYELSLVRKQSEMQLEHYKRLSEKYEEARKVIHDVKKHLNTLEMIQNIDIEKSKEYRQMIEKQMETLIPKFKYSNPMLSVVISQKLKECKDKNIVTKTNIMDISIDFMNDMDITSLFLNLLDNAIEATEILEESKRRITIEMGNLNGFIVICVENTFDGKVEKKNGKYTSLKAGHSGLGINIINEVAQKYRGRSYREVNEYMFKTKLIFPIQ